MDYGKIIAYDKPDVLKKKYTKDIATITSTDADKLDDILMKYGLIFDKKDNVFHLEINDFPLFIQIIGEHQQMISDLEVKKGTLNDVFLEITGKDIRR